MAGRRSRALAGAVVSSHLLTSALAASSITLDLTSTPSNLSQTVDLSFGGFGIEPSNLFSYTGGAEANQLTINLLENLGNYTGKPPHIRIGGNTQDYMIYDESQDEWAQITNPDAVGQGNIASDSMLIGPNFFTAANRLPAGTPITWGLNLAYDLDDYIDQIVLMANQVLSRCTSLDIVAFEIGNEPDLYSSNGFRNSSWTSTMYSQQWLDRAAALYEQVVKPAGLPSGYFEAGATSHTSGTTFDISVMAADTPSVQEDLDGSVYLSTYNQHDYTYFVSVTGYPLTLQTIMNFDTTEAQFATWLTQIEQAQAAGFPYALREMGMVGPLGVTNVSDTFGGALYTLNFLLWTTTLNVTGVNFHMTANSYTSAWQPSTYNGLGPHVRPIYYGHAAFNQIIGPTCQAQVSQYSLSDLPSDYTGFVRAYSIYQGGSLQSIAVINSKMANTTETNKANLTVSVTLPSSLAGKTVHLAYLTNDGIDAKYNTTWNGISFEQDSLGTATQLDDSDETVTVGDDGSLSFSVRDSAAVVANIGSKVGDGLTADKTACSAMASRTPGTHASTSGTSSSAASATRAPTFTLSSGVLVTCLVPIISLMTGFFL
ncbi:Beta-glucuronidase [Cytospora mali]|uniref:Beta-glucuronidase n=1 Tax=Cytospora mali TaxID=578113 RepID=A0A194VFV0_CYTMA|nr:Beta-glucuronidase [Valsa mali var. pyri (nom. inval.)]